MRKLLVTSLLALAVFSVTACKEPDPNKIETHLVRIEESSTRSQGFTGLEKFTKTITTARDNDALLKEFGEKVVPVFDKVWSDATEQQEKMLTMLREVGRPEAAPIWIKALTLDGSGAARKKVALALEGIDKAHATDTAKAVSDLLDKLIESPALDEADKDVGRLRLMLAKTLGGLGDKSAVPVLIKAMEQPKAKQPVVVHKAAAVALGHIGDVSAADALLTVTFRVPDANTSTNIGLLARQALAGIGEPAVPTVLKMMRGEHVEVQKLAAKNGVLQPIIQQTAVKILGAIGARSAVDELVAFMPKEDCGAKDPDPKGKKPNKGEEEEVQIDEASGNLRGVVANTLGLIGDPKAAEAMCSCISATDNPGDMFPLIEALGRVGGEVAVKCLSEVVSSGSYNPEIVVKGFELEPRWDAARFAILAATPDELAGLKVAMASNTDATVKEKLAQWDAGVKLVESCKVDKACYLSTLKNTNANWFAREKAAFEVARLSPGDPKIAEEVARAFKVRNPDARVSMAWLPARMLGDQKCPGCVTAYQAVLDAEKLSMDKSLQASVLQARATIARLRAPHGAESK